MAKKIEEPTIIETESHGDNTKTITRHPAFAQIRATRVNGRSALYGSDFVHNAFITISIRRSELHRDLNHDWHFGRNEIIEVALSEAQWATFVSAMNIGDGVPCTIRHINWEETPGLPEPRSRADQFAQEIQKGLADTIAKVEKAKAEIADLGLPKGKTAKLTESLDRLLRDLNGRLPYVAKTFEEHVEETVEKAKQEVHGYMNGVIQRTGIAALNGEPLPLQIDHKGVESDGGE